MFPTREETVAALSRHRERLLERFRIPTPPWEVRQVGVGQAQHLRARRRARDRDPANVAGWQRAETCDAIDGDPPFAVKPAIKEHFLYATGAKAWRADTRAELSARVRDAGGRCSAPRR